ncbi:delta-12-fatty acid desaturase [Coprinopsis cinerea AmutBmut pab1-1]|nr:delta-12-fatty acid desaturase [Coprinopsis cinerea AmutBmut pab1-1]
MFRLWGNGPEYEARLGKPFAPPTATLKDIHDAVPKQLLRNDPFKSTLYLVRDIVMSLFLYTLAQQITSCASSDFGGLITTPYIKALVKGSLWCVYWWFQSLVNAGIFCLGHDAGHGTLYDSKIVNNTIGFVLHSYLLIPYFSWRATHHAHHKATSSMERDENYVPYTRSKYNLPDETKATKADYEEIFEETPLWTLWRMFVMQMFGWWVYLSQNTMGAPMYPPGTNHFNPNSALFKPEQRNSIILSNVGIGSMAVMLYLAGKEFFLWYYLPPYLLVNHWIVMFTYLHHSDPTIPHYRKNEWTFLRGAAATVDRPLLGWMGRFFFHNISHDHVAHHFFLRAPFYNGPEITKRIKAVLKDDYNYDSTPSFYALYRSFTQCLFVDDEGDIIFYKNKEGKAVREVDPKYLAQAAARKETQTQHPPLKED